MHVLVEEREDVLHRVEARAAVDDLLQRVGAQLAEALQHERVLQVDHREHVARNAPHRVADRPAEVPLRLGVLGPFDVVQRVRELELARAADLALHDVVGGRIALHEPAQGLREVRVGLVRIGGVRMVDPVLHKVERVLLLQPFEHDLVVVPLRTLALAPGDRGDEALRLGLDLLDGLRRAVDHFAYSVACPNGSFQISHSSTTSL